MVTYIKSSYAILIFITNKIYIRKENGELNNMMKLRVTYGKSKEATYLSHLDMMNVFECAFRRASVPLKYSEGFTPRPELVFASPLSVGIESTGEIFEVSLTEELEIPFFIREVNKVLPGSITILGAEVCKADEKNIMSRVFASVYTIEILYSEEKLKDKTVREIADMKTNYNKKLEEFLSQTTILAYKNSKKLEDRVDITPMIKHYEFMFGGKLEITVDTGSNSNLKPDIIMESFGKYLDEEVEYKVRREKILYK